MRGCVNAVRAITLSAVHYVFHLLAPEDIPNNAGCLRPIEVLTRPGTVADCTFPAAVSGGNVETSQRLVDVLLGALANALPDRIPAASCGSMNNLTIGGVDPRTGGLFAYYETVAGGAGGGPQGQGASGIQTHMTNTLNTPVEALEHAYPLRVRRYLLRDGSGGEGRHRGGDGVVKEVELLGRGPYHPPERAAGLGPLRPAGRCAGARRAKRPAPGGEGGGASGQVFGGRPGRRRAGGGDPRRGRVGAEGVVEKKRTAPSAILSLFLRPAGGQGASGYWPLLLPLAGTWNSYPQAGHFTRWVSFWGWWRSRQGR